MQVIAIQRDPPSLKQTSGKFNAFTVQFSSSAELGPSRESERELRSGRKVEKRNLCSCWLLVPSNISWRFTKLTIGKAQPLWTYFHLRWEKAIESVLFSGCLRILEHECHAFTTCLWAECPADGEGESVLV